MPVQKITVSTAQQGNTWFCGLLLGPFLPTSTAGSYAVPIAQRATQGGTLLIVAK
jgi:hypothetical protein